MTSFNVMGVRAQIVVGVGKMRCAQQVDVFITREWTHTLAKNGDGGNLIKTDPSNFNLGDPY